MAKASRNLKSRVVSRGASAPGALDGHGLRALLATGLSWLSSQEEAINALNVYPVPDGDTGTNMRLTLRYALERCPPETASRGASAVMEAVAEGALYGARGNSGAILSQVLRGFARGIQGKACLSGGAVAEAFQEAQAAAYSAVPKPAEGTILTVIRHVAEAARGQIGSDASPLAVLEKAAATAKESVARTPLLLEVLRENGVVDAGGQGLAVLLEGMARCAGGDAKAPPVATAPVSAALARARGGAGTAFGYCTEFFIEGCTEPLEQVREALQSMGDSILAIEDGKALKVHLHTRTPEPVLAWGRGLGTVTRVKVDNIDQQHVEFAARREATAQGKVGVVAVASGEGMEAVFRSLGASAIVEGGQTMNPSAGEVLEAVTKVAQDEVIVLPNNPNVLLAAQQAAQLVKDKRVLMVPTQDMAQGVAALVAFNFEADAGDNVEAMGSALEGVKTGEVTWAVRGGRVGGRTFAAGQPIGLVDGVPTVASDTLEDTVTRLIERLGVEGDAVVTLYYGKGVSAADAEGAAEAVRRRSPGAEVHCVYGGQPQYPYLASIE